MIALSIKWPWSALIIHGIKDCENRTWSYLPTFRGPIAIHQGKTIDEDAARFLLSYPWAQTTAIIDLGNCRGCVIGTVELYDVARRPPKSFSIHPPPPGRILTRAETGNQFSEWHESGMVGLYLRNPRPLEKPVSVKGRLGFFNIEVKI